MPSARMSAVAPDQVTAREEAWRCPVVPYPRGIDPPGGRVSALSKLHWRLPPRAKSAFKRGAGLTHPPRAIFFFNNTLFFRYNGAHSMGRDAIIPDIHHIATRTVG